MYCVYPQDKTEDGSSGMDTRREKAWALRELTEARRKMKAYRKFEIIFAFTSVKIFNISYKQFCLHYTFLIVDGTEVSGYAQKNQYKEYRNWGRIEYFKSNSM
jgi:hypothetical protein